MLVKKAALRAANEHLGLILTVTVTLLALFKLIAVSEGDLALAASLTTYVGPTNVLLGAMTTFVPITVVSLATLALLFTIDGPQARARLWPAVVLVIMLTTAAHVIPVYLMAPVTLIMAYHCLNAWRSRHSRRWASGNGLELADLREIMAALPRSLKVLTILFAATTTLMAMTPTPWLLAETVSVKGVKSKAVYVVSDSGDTIVALQRSPRTLVRFPAGDSQRALCSANQGIIPVWATHSLRSLVSGNSPANLPKCPD